MSMERLEGLEKSLESDTSARRQRLPWNKKPIRPGRSNSLLVMSPFAMTRVHVLVPRLQPGVTEAEGIGRAETQPMIVVRSFTYLTSQNEADHLQCLFAPVKPSRFIQCLAPASNCWSLQMIVSCRLTVLH